MYKKILNVFVSATLILCVLPVAAFASECGAEEPAAAFASVRGVEVSASVLANARPDWQAEWQGYSNGGSAVTLANTPSATTTAAWTFDYATYVQDAWASCSEPVLAGGFVFIAVNDKLLKIDKVTGSVVREVALNARISYTCRPAYTNGIIVVPLSGGSVQALTADELSTAWATDAVSSAAQASCTVSVSGKYVYVETVDSVWDAQAGTSVFSNGYLLKIDTDTGVVAWQIHDDADGYYWNGAVVSGDYLVISTLSGHVRAINNETGEVTSECALGVNVNTDCVLSADGKSVYVVGRDGRLFVLSLGGGAGSGSGAGANSGMGSCASSDSNSTAGALSVIAEKNIGLTGSTCTPTIYGGKMYVGGEAAVEVDAATGVATITSALAIVDLSDFSTQVIKDADGAPLPAGGIKGVPLVSVSESETRVYFTVNYAETADWVTYTSGGGVYSYKVGDAQAALIYDGAGHNQYCDSPVACDAQGCLYYINDSGTLFKLNAGAKQDGGSGDDKDDKQDDDGNKSNDSGGDNSGDDGDSANNVLDNQVNYQAAVASIQGSDANSSFRAAETSNNDTLNNSADNSASNSSNSGNSSNSSNSNTSGDSAYLTNSINEKSGAAKAAANQDGDANDDAENNTKAPFNWLPIAGIMLGVLIAGGAIWALVRSRKGE